MAIKDHVGKHGQTLERQLNANYGDLLGLLKQATDIKNPTQQLQACKKLGQINLEAQAYNDVAPQLKAAILNQIQATTQFNIDKAEILKAAGKGSTSIEKAASSVYLANTDYKNHRTENALDFHQARVIELQRHQLEMSYIRLQGMIRQSLATVDSQAKFINASNQPAIRQIQENANYQKTAMNHLLGNGERSNLELIHRKDYQQVNNKPGIVSVISNVAQKFGLFV